MMRLLPFGPEHFDRLASWFHEERDVVQWGGPGVCFPLGPAQMHAMLERGGDERPSRSCWMVLHGDRIVGHAQLAFDWRNGNATLSRVAVAPEARGRGLAEPLVRRVLQEAFQEEGIERVELNVYPWNEAALRTYRRVGFVQEGVKRSSCRVGSERWDTVVMGLLREEWRSAGELV